MSCHNEYTETVNIIARFFVPPEKREEYEQEKSSAALLYTVKQIVEEMLRYMSPYGIPSNPCPNVTYDVTDKYNQTATMITTDNEMLRNFVIAFSKKKQSLNSCAQQILKEVFVSIYEGSDHRLCPSCELIRKKKKLSSECEWSFLFHLKFSATPFLSKDLSFSV